MKKWLSALLAFCMLLTMAPLSVLAAEEPTLVVAAVEARAGEDVAVPIDMAGNSGLTGLKIKLTYPDALTVNDVDFADAFATTEDNSVDKSNPVTLVFGDKDAVTFNGTIAAVNFTVSPDAATGTYPLELEVVYAFNEDDSCPVTCVKGDLTIVDFYTVKVDETIENGAVTATPAFGAKGDEIALSVEPDEGYELDVLTVVDADGNDVDVTEDCTFTMPAAEVYVYASFVPAVYEVDVFVVDSDGAESEHATVTVDKQFAAIGEEVTLTIVPDEGYELVELNVYDADLNEITVTDNKFAMPASDVGVIASFKEIPPDEIYNVTIATSENGTISADPISAPAGAEITLTITPNEGYELDELVVVDQLGNAITVKDNKFTMPAANVGVSVDFKLAGPVTQQFNVKFDANGGSESMTDKKTNDNGELTLPDCGFLPPDNTQKFDGWEVNGEKKQPGDVVTFTADTTVKALWVPYETTNNGGCYVATSVYGSYDCPQVWTLRRFRDNVLAKTWYGRLFIRAYYAVSPTCVKLFGHTEAFQNFFRGILDPWVASLQADGFESTPYNDIDW